MTAFDSFPLGRPAFISNILDRASHLRSDDAKLMSLEGHRDARAYVVYRDSLVMKQEADGPRALLSIDEALKFGANPGTIFLGLREGAAVFGMGISAAAVEKLLPRNDVAVTELTLSNTELGYSAVKTVDIEPGEEHPVSVQPTGELSANAVPWAEVWMDGKKIGETPTAHLIVPLGTHEVVFKNPDHPDRRVTVTVSANNPVTASVDFSK